MLFFNRTMTLNTPPKRPRSGWKTVISQSWIGLHNLQISIPLNISGIISKRSLPSIQDMPKEYGRFGKEWQKYGTI